MADKRQTENLTERDGSPMERVKKLYVRHRGAQIPVYSLASDAEADKLAQALESGDAKVLAEYVQYGISYDQTHEVILFEGNEYAIQTITPGGELRRAKARRKAQARNG